MKRAVTTRAVRKAAEDCSTYDNAVSMLTSEIDTQKLSALETALKKSPKLTLKHDILYVIKTAPEYFKKLLLNHHNAQSKESQEEPAVSDKILKETWKIFSEIDPAKFKRNLILWEFRNKELINLEDYKSLLPGLNSEELANAAENLLASDRPVEDIEKICEMVLLIVKNRYEIEDTLPAASPYSYIGPCGYKGEEFNKLLVGLAVASDGR